MKNKCYEKQGSKLKKNILIGFGEKKGHVTFEEQIRVLFGCPLGRPSVES